MSTRAFVRAQQFAGPSIKRGGASGVDILDYHSANRPGEPLGAKIEAVVTDSNGVDQILKLRLCYNSSGAALPKGTVVMTDHSATPLDTCNAKVGTAGAPIVSVLGVTTCDVAIAEYFWAACEGTIEALSNGTTTAGRQQKVAASGTLTDGTIGSDEHCAHALEANASASTLSMFSIRCGG